MKPNLAALALVTIGILLMFSSTMFLSDTLLSAHVFDNCDSLTTSSWMNIDCPTATITIDSANKVEGTGSVRVDIAGPEWDLFLRFGRVPNDFTATPIVSFKYMVSSAAYGQLGFGMWYERNPYPQYSYGALPLSGANTWQTVEIDMRTLSNGTTVPVDRCAYWELSWNMPYSGSQLVGATLWIDDIQVGSNVLPPPTVQLSASSSSITLGNSTTLTATAAGGTPPYTVSFNIGSTVLNAQSGVSSTATYAYTPLTAGIYRISAVATDSNGSLATSSAIALTVTETPVEPPPTGNGTSTLVISESQGGSTIPAAGTYNYSATDTVTLTATPSNGYKFENWLFSDGTTRSESSITLTMSQSYSVQPVFSEETVTPPPATSNSLKTPLQIAGGAIIAVGVSVQILSSNGKGKKKR